MIKSFNVHNMLAVQNYMSSGSIFLQSLLDGHSNILSTPALYSREIFKIWNNSLSLNKSNLIEFFIESLPWFDPDKTDVDNGLNRLGKKANEIAVIDKKKFTNILSLLLIDFDSRPSRKTFLQACHIAYALTLERNINKNSLYILFPIHTQSKQIAKYAIEDYPNIKFLYTIRDPKVLLNSLIKRHIKLNLNLKHPLPESQIRHLILNKVRVDGDIEVFGDNPYFNEKSCQFKAVRLEDLHESPKKTMQLICKWLSIPFEKNLLKSTFNGKQWWNKPASGQLSGFDINKINEKLTFLSKLDVIRVDFLNSKKRQVWGYKKKPNFLLKVLECFVFFVCFLIPFKSELLKLPSKFLALEFLMSYKIFRSNEYLIYLKKIENIKTKCLFRNYANELIEKKIGVNKTAEVIIHYDLSDNINIELENVRNFKKGQVNSFVFKIKKGLKKKRIIIFDTFVLLSRIILFLKFFFLIRLGMIKALINGKKAKFVDLLKNK